MDETEQALLAEAAAAAGGGAGMTVNAAPEAPEEVSQCWLLLCLCEYLPVCMRTCLAGGAGIVQKSTNREHAHRAQQI